MKSYFTFNGYHHATNVEIPAAPAPAPNGPALPPPLIDTLFTEGKLSNGQDVAVKRLSNYSLQGEIEFKSEVMLVAKLQHRNLVKLIGYCLERRERLLVYEFVPNKSLDFFIFDEVGRAQLDWEKRHKIITGIARDLLYLHEDSRLTIIHRNLKASIIRLDAEMHLKISNFGMARLDCGVQCERSGEMIAIVGDSINHERVIGSTSLGANPEASSFFSICVLERTTQLGENHLWLAQRRWSHGDEDGSTGATSTTLSSSLVPREVHGRSCYFPFIHAGSPRKEEGFLSLHISWFLLQREGASTFCGDFTVEGSNSHVWVMILGLSFLSFASTSGGEILEVLIWD
ncbi:putative cysteine-rich receptor-like protein kinase 39 [Vigna angularis]|uniref:putative cysteine-rich receptor-like protein kinase 39 n=1 Tax=Phaseolus angularis TaxID=3914 RepID=UPI00080A40AC|nr:putative cysteine-rich receptor-like protein kinase 39 [Vigna angularis]